MILLLISISAKAEDTCSRAALINFQEILVDTNSTQKGEGLRYYIEKDKVANSYLEKYQNGTKIKWHNAALGTIGSALLLGGLLTNNSDSNKKIMLIGVIKVLL